MDCFREKTMFGLGVVRPNIFEKEFFFINMVLEKGDNLKHVLVSRLKNV